jgi:hypothetical protein
MRLGENVGIHSSREVHWMTVAPLLETLLDSPIPASKINCVVTEYTPHGNNVTCGKLS